MHLTLTIGPHNPRTKKSTLGSTSKVAQFHRKITNLATLWMASSCYVLSTPIFTCVLSLAGGNTPRNVPTKPKHQLRGRARSSAFTTTTRLMVQTQQIRWHMSSQQSSYFPQRAGDPAVQCVMGTALWVDGPFAFLNLHRLDLNFM